MKLNFTGKGTGVALVTPFLNNGEIDFAGLEKITHSVIAGGVDYIVALGTTAEVVTLKKEERAAVLKCITNVNQNRVDVVIGIGGNNTFELLETFETTDFTSISGILSVTPYYNKPTQQGLLAHYQSLAKNAPKPIILYNVPGRTACNLLPQTAIELTKTTDKIIGIKEASGNIQQVMELLVQKPAHFTVLSGDDNLNFSILALGGEGVISVSANAFPKLVSQLAKNALNGNWELARSIHYQLFELTNALFEQGNPAGIKAVLAQMGFCEPVVRLPLVKADDAFYAKLKKLTETALTSANPI